jgi:hypothetical protein
LSSETQLASSHDISIKIGQIFGKRTKIAQEKFNRRVQEALNGDRTGSLFQHLASSGPWSNFLYAVDAAQRSILFWDTLRERGNNFVENAQRVPEVYVVLGIAMTERHILGVALEGETMRRDVMQKTVSFSDHQVRICGRTDPDLRQETCGGPWINWASTALPESRRTSRAATCSSRNGRCSTRLQLLERQGAGMRAVFGSDATPGSEELARLLEQIEENEKNLDSLGLRAEAFERELDRVCEVLADPSPHIYIESKQFRLDRMNVVLPENSAQAGEEVTFQIALIPTTPQQMRAFALVRFARCYLLPAASLFDEAARLLI